MRTMNHRFICCFLFCRPKETAAPFDLISLNVQRGRDHGLPPYTKMLNYFDRNNVPSNFEELLPFIPEEVYKRSFTVYGTWKISSCYL
jgi:hypothetical protein